MFILAYANDNDALIPELWAQESLAILEENMVIGNLVHRDFENEIANYGDVVNTRKPAAFTAVRKTDADAVTTQDASSTNIPVALNQHFHTSFVIKDGELSKAFKDLVAFYLQPATVSIAQAIDKCVGGQVIRFAAANGSLDTTAGVGGCGLGASSAKPITALRNMMNKNKAPTAGRNLILTADSETDFLNLQAFTDASQVGDMGQALREAFLGRKYGFNIYMAQNQPSVTRASSTATSTVSTTVKSANNAAKGATSVVLTSVSNIVAGCMLDIGGDPQLVITVNSSTTTCGVYPGLRRAAAAGVAVTAYKMAQVDLTAGYAAGWSKAIVTDTMTDFVVGQPIIMQDISAAVTAQAAAALSSYTIIDVSSDGLSITLDRPLAATAANNALISPYPVGNYNFGFHKNAVALVTRPLALPRTGTGALAGVASYNGLGIRVVITYDGSAQGHRVTVDLLCGVAQLDEDLGAVMFM